MKKPKKGYHDFYWYRVRRGDSLYKIARRNRITLSRLKRENGIKRGSFIRVGQRLKVPSRNYVPKKTRHPLQKRNINSVHVVRRGESLNFISNKYNISIARLKSANNLNGTTIHPGQKIQLQNSSSTDTKQQKHHEYRKNKGVFFLKREVSIGLQAVLSQF